MNNLSKKEKEYLKIIIGNRIDNKKYKTGKVIINGQTYYYCVNKKAIKQFRLEEIKE